MIGSNGQEQWLVMVNDEVLINHKGTPLIVGLSPIHDKRGENNCWESIGGFISEHI